jgi:protein phosphatase 1 regulatory subunit 10
LRRSLSFWVSRYPHNTSRVAPLFLFSNYSGACAIAFALLFALRSSLFVLFGVNEEVGSPPDTQRKQQKNTLSPHMRSSSDRFSYNSKHNKEKLKTTKGGGGRPNERNSNELADRRSSGLAKESRTGNRHRSSSSSSASSSSSSSSGDEGSGHKKKNKKKEKKNKKKDKQRQQQQQLGSPNSKVMTASMSWRAKKTSQSDSAAPAPGPGTQIIISAC